MNDSLALPATRRDRAAGLPLRYLLSVGTSQIVLLVSICAIACGVYMIERTVGILEIALRYNFSLGSSLSLMLLQLPTLAEFALPVATYTAAHFIMLGRRERREFVALAAAGVSPAALVMPLTIAVVAAGLLSIAFTNTIAPAATRAYRLIETAARAQVLAHRLPESRFFTGPDAVLYVGGTGTTGSAMRLFQFENGEIKMILASGCVSPHTSASQILLRLCDGEAYLFNKPLALGGAPTRVQMGEAVYPFDASSVLGARRGSSLPTRSVMDLLGNGDGNTAGDRAEGVSRLLAAFACLVAAALAVVSVALTSQNTRILTFIAGSLAMFALMALRDPFSQLVAHVDPSIVGISGGIFVLVALGLPGFLAQRLRDRLVAPSMAKT